MNCHAQDDWLPKAAAAITERIGRYAANEVKVRWDGLIWKLGLRS